VVFIESVDAIGIEKLPSGEKAPVGGRERGLFGGRVPIAGNRGDLVRHDRLRILFAQMKIRRGIKAGAC